MSNMIKRRLVTLRVMIDSLIMLTALYSFSQNAVMKDGVLKGCFMLLFIIASHSCTDHFGKYLPPKEDKQGIGKLDKNTLGIKNDR